MRKPALLLLFMAACGDGTTAQPPLDGGTDALTPPAAALTVGGRFALETPADLTATTFAPQAAADTLARLRLLRDDPAAALVMALDEAGVPFAKELFSALPDALASRVRGFINEYAATRPLGPEVTTLLAEAERSLLRFDLLTELDVPAEPPAPAPPTGAAPSLGRHALRGVRFPYDGGRLPIVVPRAANLHDGPVVTDPPVLVELERPATLLIGDHAFGLPLGSYAFAGLDALSDRRSGAPLRVALGRALDCPGLAKSVSSRCLGPLACVGHESDLRQICEAGLDAVVNKLREELTKHDYDAVRFERGRATARDDAPADGRADRLEAGMWTATLDAGQGPRPGPTSFTGVRN